MVVAWLGIGALVGCVGAVVARVGPWWAAALVHDAVPYVLLLVLISVTAPRIRSAAVRAAACFVPFVLAYYTVVALQFGAIPTTYAAAWLGAAVTVCPVAAASIRWAASRRGVVPAAVCAGAGAIALSDGSLGNLVRVALGRLDPSLVQPVLVITAAAGIAVAAVAVVLVPREARTRLLAVALLVPFAVLSTFAGWALHFGIGPYL